MTTITGTIGKRPIVTTHESPSDLALGEKTPGAIETFNLAAYTNTGNVAQKVTLTASNLRNATVDSIAMAVSGIDSEVLQPGESTHAVIRFTVRDVEDTDFHFDINDSWEVA